VSVGTLVLIAAAVSSINVGSGTVSEPTPPRTVTSSTDSTELAAELLINSGKFEDARKILLALAEVKPNDPQVLFLLGLLDIQDKDFESAIHRFHKILVSQPKSVRVRLELARAYFLNGEYGNAENQFRFARAGKLPPTVLANIDKFLNQIRQLKTVSYGFSVAIAPDSNLNAAPAISAVTLYGLPFQLSSQAQQTSGIGLALDMSGELAPRIAKRVKLRMGALLHRSQYRATAFDDMTLTAYVGPRLTLKRWDFNLFGSVSRRWFGDHVFTNIYGATADATYYINTRMGVTATLGGNTH
jgi:tetratricopeptide (TPR) repeat protein